MQLLTLSALLVAATISTVASDKETSSLVTEERVNNTLVKAVYLQILRGRDGRDGLPGRDGVKGVKGDTGPVGAAGPKSGGVVYTRWGRKSCPTGAQLVYEGITGGSHFTKSGGGANYVCLTKDPQYKSTKIPKDYSSMYGTEYEGVNNIFPGKHNHNVPCAVCYASTKTVKLMIPGRTSCPSSWTREYEGYLMTSYDFHARNAVYECVDQNPESIGGSHGDVNGALFYFTVSTCTGLPCPPYVSNRAVTCVICTK